ncbi:hypothetical protein E8E13_000832 [Curvularia kusanoi]|uniref:Cytochrome P450 monooxygenase n=1 Tax=Curvularia kusanoi TaxID=90978 RepID=A0A9P4W3A6_CURKU|nr:hypothetical protein E8E13_000832 [Curvularia kusanoi]
MSILDHYFFHTTGFVSSIGILLAFTTFYLLGALLYNKYFSPLRRIPGPWLAISTGIPYALHMRSGTIANWVRELHEQYGDVVRVTPTELSFISGETAWPDIYGFRTGKHKNTGAYLKDRSWFAPPENGVWSIIATDEVDHSRTRRNLSHAFSTQALRKQESLLMSYVDLLIHKLTLQADQGNPVDIMRWYNFTTFDIIADLAFGEPLYCLRDSQYHKWVNMIFTSIKAVPTLSIRNKYLLFRTWDTLCGLFTDTQAQVNARYEFFDMAKSRVTARLEKDTNRPDFLTFIFANQAKSNLALSRDEIDVNMVALLLAGSETTATTISGVTYLLLRNLNAYRRLVHELRTAFKDSKDITFDAVNDLPFLHAALQETLRIYPAVPTGFPRLVPGEGQLISGRFIPGGTSVYVSQHAANHSTRNFADPDSYVPERWLEGERPEKYADDKRDVMQPFSFGPRNCLGKK